MSSTATNGTQASTKPRGTVADVASLLRKHDRILIVSHIRPDGDCLGSATALAAGLQALGKTVACYNASDFGDKFDFVPNIRFLSTKLPAWKAELTVFVDCGGIRRVSPDFVPQGFVLNIDHHATNDVFGDLNYIEISAAAVGEQIFHLLNELGVTITQEIATSLFVSLAADTGSFRYPSTNHRTFELAAALAKLGANPGFVCRHLFESRSPQEVILAGRGLSRLKFECGGKMSWSELRWSDYAEVGGEDFEPDGLATEIRGIDGVEISVLFHELENGGLRVGFRGKGEVDCAKIASALGGGGHVNASGYFNDKVKYEQERDRILEMTRAHVAATYAAR